jgi:transposase
MRGKALSVVQRERIIGAHLNGIKLRIISSELNIPITTVYDTIKRYDEKGTAQPKKRSGRPKNFSEREKRVLKRVVREDRFAPLGDVASRLNTRLGTTFHISTVRRYIHDIGLKSSVPRRKPLLTKKQ